MFNGIYAGATAVELAARQHEVIAHNLAHSHTPGFRRHHLAFEVRQPEAAAHDVAGGDRVTLRGARLASQTIDFSPGPIQQTGRPLDVAISGDGFFVVQGPDGPLYTRNGSFHLSRDGDLVTSSGYPVLGEDGAPINWPADRPISQISITADGAVAAGAQRLGELQLAAFDDLTQLEQVGTTLFRARGDLPPRPADVMLQQQALELSNTVPVNELVHMIAGMRHYQAAQTAMRTIAEAIRQNTASSR